MNSYSGRLADVGESRCNCLPDRKVLALLKDYVSVIRLLKHLVVRETKRRRSSLVRKSAQTSAECNKLIMISRAPSYGRLEYLVLGLSCESHLVTLINVVGFLMMILNWD